MLTASLLAHFRLGIGDPTPLGWAITCTYFVSVVTCLRAWRQSAEAASSRHLTLARFWLALGVLMFLLGLNKQLDLQTLAIELGRDLSLHLGLYEKRRLLQKGLLISMAAGAFGGGLIVVYLLRSVFTRVLGALFGVCLLGTFVLMRAALFQSANPLPVGWVEHSAWVLEVSGICFVIVNAHLAGRRMAGSVKS